MLKSFTSRKSVRKGYIVFLIQVISLLRSTLSRLIGLGVICILFQLLHSIKWLTISLITDLVTIHFLLALTDLLNDVISFSLDGTPALTLSAINSNPKQWFVRLQRTQPMSPTLHTQLGVSHRCKEALGDISSSIEHNQDNL